MQSQDGDLDLLSLLELRAHFVFYKSGFMPTGLYLHDPAMPRPGFAAGSIRRPESEGLNSPRSVLAVRLPA